MFHIIQFSAPSLTAKLNYTSDIMSHHQKEIERGRGGRERGADAALHSQLGNPCILISCWLNILWFDGRLAASFLASRLAGYGQHPDEHRLDKADRLDSSLHWRGGGAARKNYKYQDCSNRIHSSRQNARTSLRRIESTWHVWLETNKWKVNMPGNSIP